jgi:hypothetical protein
MHFYYGLFACINLVDDMPLFSTVFLFNDRFSAKFDRFLSKFVRESPRQFSEKFTNLSVKSADNSVKPAKIQDSRIRLFFCRLHCVSAKFFQISLIFLIFSKPDRIAMVQISSIHRTFEHWWQFVIWGDLGPLKKGSLVHVAPAYAGFRERV